MLRREIIGRSEAFRTNFGDVLGDSGLTRRDSAKPMTQFDSPREISLITGPSSVPIPIERLERGPYNEGNEADWRHF